MLALSPPGASDPEAAQALQDLDATLQSARDAMARGRTFLALQQLDVARALVSVEAHRVGPSWGRAFASRPVDS